ncbi:pilus assembly protein [Shewanella loihica]|uniref:Type IV pilin biogenesis protein, putative n=1 Tax=Shewanella loihica (strain ATCC BAA-1088 / PV-4) TaxID=323850 RepID=A3QBX9_SHELP|nr:MULTISPECIES: PilC/PilY family type IV pilus protein [Shewanella]ABO22977.1 type IV pilin biogenesis protein, putative [Shewanella loihica PV-4]QYJ83483.1 type IV pilin biogenesis protein [Shewanella aegiceratis]
MFKKLLCSTVMALVVVSGMTIADDTELYLIDSNVRSGKRPQVLFVFDNSGSMSTEDQNATSSYCSADDKANGICDYADGFGDYLAGYSGYINEKGIYWNAGGIDNTSNMPTPDEPKDSRRFYAANNNCHKAAIALQERGRYTGYLREFKSSGNTGKWYPLADNEGFNRGQVVDCHQDILDSDPENPGLEKVGGSSVPFDPGYPIDSKKMYTDSTDSSARDYSLENTEFGKGTPVTLYTAHYLVWYQWVTTTEEGQNSGGTGTRLEVAKDALTTALTSLSIPIDAGLAVFNLNYPDEGDADGGRIVYDIKEMTSTNQNSLISLINGMPAQTNTPLCETLYEAYQYFSGGPVTFGNDDKNAQGSYKIDGYIPNSPPSILTGGNYTTPFKKCPDTAYIIYITDGAPTIDSNADSAIISLASSAENTANYSGFDFVNSWGDTETSYLPALAAYMYNNDMVKGVKDANGIDNKQNVRLFTIGFSEGADVAAKLLEEAAFRGGNPRDDSGVSKGYYVAKNGLDLVAAMDDALKSILSIDSSFTSPSIASNNFDKTQTYNSAYFAMFLPGKGPRWSGNLKKLKVNSSGEIVGPGGSSKAIDSNGNIAASTCTYWNTCPANNIDGNKVNSGGVLPILRSTLKSRNIRTNVGTSIVGIQFSGFASAYSQEDLDWLYGVDVDDDDNDGNIYDAREDIMGDPLHSKPLAINFGEKPNADGTENLDVRVIVGTNQGLVHMFKDSDSGSNDYSVGSVTETWAFIPQELWHNVPTLRKNYSTGSHSVYGMDLSPVAYTETDSSGKVNKAWVFLGMRRGGTSYYALDITNPDAPSFKWKIDSNSTGFEELGQSWSEPVVTFVPGIDDPVLVIGGGMASSEGTGEAVYIVNAKSGAFIKKFSATGMASVPNKVAVLDSNNDGITDRIYAADIGGNIWRMDMPESTQSTWSTFKFASIATSTSPNDRMFFAEPSVAQTQFNNIHDNSGELTYQSVPYDAVTIGTGNRTHPLDINTNDMFYVFQDRNVVTKTFTSTDAPAALTISELYDVTTAAPSSQSDNVTFGTKRGWFYDYSVAGEKTLSASLIFDGKVYFTSFIPPTRTDVDLDAGICGFAGQGRLYVFDLHKGTRSYSETYYEIGERVPDTPQIVIPKPEEGEDSTAYIIGVGKGECEDGECKGTVSLGSGLSTNRIYYHLDEKN